MPICNILLINVTYLFASNCPLINVLLLSERFSKRLAAVTRRLIKATEECKFHIYEPNFMSFVLDICRIYFFTHKNSVISVYIKEID